MVILAVLVPVIFQVLMQGRKQEKRHTEIMELLRKLESSRSKSTT